MMQQLFDILSFGLRAALILAIGLGARFLLRNAAASTRMALWYAIGLALFILPILLLFGVGLPLPIPDLWPSSVTTATAQQGTAVSQNGSAVDLPMFVLLVYLAGVAFVVIRQTIEHIRLYRLQTRARSPQDKRITAIADEARRALGIWWNVPVRITKDLPVPVCCGFLKPTVLLPASAADWSDEMLRAAIRHELSHVRRYDNLFGVAALIITTLNWFNPLAWLAFRRYCEDREEACDAEAITSGLNAADYAAGVLAFAALNSRNSIPRGIAAFSGTTSFKRRISAAITGARFGRAHSSISLLTLIVAGFCLMGIATVQPQKMMAAAQQTNSLPSMEFDDSNTRRDSPFRSAVEGFYEGMGEVLSGEAFVNGSENLTEGEKGDDTQIVIRKQIIR